MFTPVMLKPTLSFLIILVSNWKKDIIFTYYLSKQNHILSPHDEYSSRDVSKFLPHMDAFNSLMEN